MVRSIVQKAQKKGGSLSKNKLINIYIRKKPQRMLKKRKIKKVLRKLTKKELKTILSVDGFSIM